MRTAIASCAFLAAAVFTTPATVSAVGSATGQVLPEVVPPGATIAIDIFNCPSPATTTITIEILPDGGVGFLDDSAAAVDGGATFTELLPTDTAAGGYTVRIFCKDTDATTIDTGELTFTVATLGLTLSPSSGPVGTQFTASGSGCPVGRTEFVAVWFQGAGDDVPVWDPLRAAFTATPNEDGTFAVPMAVSSVVSPGEHLVVAWCVSEGGSALTGPFQRAFTVTQGTVPATGANPVIWPAAAVLVAGVLLVVAAARRRVS